MDEIDIIGTIAKENTEWKACQGTKQTVFLNIKTQLQYSVQALMRTRLHKDIKFFTGYLTHLEKYGFKEPYTDIGEFQDIIENYLFVFKSLEVDGHMRIEDVALTIKPSCYEEGMLFESIPFYTTSESLELFIQKYQTNKGLSCGKDIDQTKKIPFILWQPIGTTEVYCIGGKTDLICHQKKLQIPTPVNTYELSMEETRMLILSPRGERQRLAFVEAGLYDSLSYQIGEKQALKAEDIQKDSTKSDTQDKEILDSLQAIINRSGFTYGEKELVNLHTSLKTKSLVVLEGMSGTGKSRLVDFYRQALGLDDKHYKCISVKASWTDESDLFGYPDMMNKCYHPDHEGVVDLLINAEKHPQELYLLCFDEMNLARVEHYFSQFLSILEMDQKQQILRLYNDTLDLSNKDNYPARITLKGNILFVGTINKDESTHHFSDKVLDRANVIRLGVTSLMDLYKEKDVMQTGNQLIKMQWTRSEYFGEAIKPGQVILTEKELDVLEQVHQMLILNQYDKGIGYRIIRQIEEYIYKIPQGQTALTREEAFDLQFTQRILSKLRGDSMSLEGVLTAENEESIPLMECLERYNCVSNFESSKKTILQKAKALKCYGYTL